MQDLTADNERILKEARTERDAMLKEARELKDGIIADAQEEAKTQANKVIQQAQATIASEKQAAIAEIKNQVAELSIGIAEKVVRAELEDKDRQHKLIKEMLKEVS